MSELGHEVLRGKGRLISNDVPNEYQVEYYILIFTTIVERPGFPGVAPHAINRGTIRRIDGGEIPVGCYQLNTDDEKIMQVENVGLGEWIILAP